MRLLISFIALCLCGYMYFHVVDMKTSDKRSAQGEQPVEYTGNSTLLSQNEDLPSQSPAYELSAENEAGECGKADLVVDQSLHNERRRRENQALRKARDAYFSSLVDSVDDNAKLASLIFSNNNNGASKISALSSLGKIHNPLFAQELIGLCTQYNKNEHCTNDAIGELTYTHRNDSQVWLRAVLYYASTKQDNKVILALEQSIQSQYSSAYVSEFVELYTQTLENAGVGNYLSNAHAAINMAIMKLPAFSHVTDWCKSHAEEPRAAHACLEFGQQLEQFASTEMDKMIGLAIQKMIHQAENNTDLIELMDKKMDQSRSARSDPEFNELGSIIFNNETLLRTYVASLSSLDEISAAKSLQDEIAFYQNAVQNVDCLNATNADSR